MHPFEKVLSVSKENIEIELKYINEISWADFWLNPRRLRGSDFLMRWSQGVWSEKRLTDAINQTNQFYAIPYGPSGTAPTDDVRAFELYFERLEAAGLGKIKRPDLLIFKIEEKSYVDDFLKDIGGSEELPFIVENELQPLIRKSLIAVECENSLWVAEKMPDYNKEMKPQKRLEGKIGLSKSAVLPTVIIKEEDRIPLNRWQIENNIPIHIWHVFFDKAYGLSLNQAEQLVKEGLIEPTIQTFQAPGGATTKKAIYKFYYHYAYHLGISTEKPTLLPDYIEDKNGHILPYVKFAGGSLQITQNALKILNNL
ncbi:AccI family restriction endonuclease [Dolichospermum circinale CS-534/05]|uniref:AccI family restriction endonuclease n=1 Tax=Dolichospermum circinale CS-537/01 TaxID=3021739 RepID=A0ABT5A8M8_9CYAN|nr:AccI family restriction endonuclease [Dolichospermum circinale]MDB9454739.1 AccI family restriction endonuclease [Dolichospermum circinale CS-541/06]MDB9460908.1 AccI family restriction endonuclease [Dolichospermum circinale CS-541/04]MDB9488316.1 AccI family restriction endonuclease [Dolichospermum circinale CS-537/01]MDB9492015.1 AccI family restriction endonuclease [Dolichospermum circinale CS-534/05]MDB9548193.1 AccI family restriction endonuclease [Dolichospermum circinale CS-1031]